MVNTPFSMDISMSFGSTPGMSASRVNAFSSSLISTEGAQFAVETELSLSLRLNAGS